MSRRTDRGPLRDMRDYAREALETFQTASADALENDRTVDWALRYLVLTVGEAATRVSPELRAAHPEIPWRKMVGMRNLLTHGYDEVERERLYDTVAVHLPKLIDQLNAILGEE